MKILIIFPYQWGYNTDYLFFCKHLQEKFEVTFIGYDLHLPTIDYGNVNVIAIPHRGLRSIFHLMEASANEVKKGNYTHVMTNYFMLCSFLNLMLPPRVRKVVDIRTSFIYPNKIKTRILNFVLQMECKFFSNISVVSTGVGQFLNLPKKSHVLPLGGPIFSNIDKNYEAFSFLYVGTFYDRDIVQTIHAFAKFVSTHSNKISLKYTIIGYGSDDEIQEIREAITALTMEAHIEFLGTIRYPELTDYFLSHNIGICYIPLTDYYDCQPPTKTFEYLLSGNIVLGTSTSENAKVIDEDNGVLVSDTAEDFYNGMVKLFEKRHLYNSRNIQSKASKYSWPAIVNDNLIPYLKSL
jgi:hypothetical protein